MNSSTYEKGIALEDEVADIYRNLDGVTKVQQNIQMLGIQVDVYVEMLVQGGIPIRIAIDTKNNSANLSADEARKCANDFTALINQRKIDKGIVVSSGGFSKSANSAILESGHETLLLKDLRVKSLDFTNYLRQWLTEYEKSSIVKYITLTAKKGNNVPVGNVEDYLLQWLNGDCSHVTLLGNYGAGKSTTLRHFMSLQAKKYLEDPENERIPIFIELREFRQAPNSKALITDTLVNEFGVNINYAKFKDMNEKGRFLVILDGFDEMADRVIDGMLHQHFEELSNLASAKGKVILSSRTHYFRDQEHVLEVHEQNDLLSRIEKQEKYEILFLNNFTDKDINSYLRAACGAGWKDLKAKIRATYDLYSLAEVPILLNMIVQVLPEMINSNTEFNRSEIYRTFTDKWLKRESWRHSLHKRDRLSFCKELAFHFYLNKVSYVHWKDLPEIIRKSLVIDKSADLDIFDSDVRTSNFLKRSDERGQYSFVHKSFMEYFVADYFYSNILAGRPNGLDNL